MISSTLTHASEAASSDEANPFSPPPTAAFAAGHREEQGVTLAGEGRSVGEWSHAVALQVRRDMRGCSETLMALAKWLRSRPFEKVPVEALEQSRTVAHLAESSVVACALNLQKLVVLLDQDMGLRRHLDREFLDVRHELQQARQALLDCQAHEERTRRAASYDTLTGLPSRSSFEGRLGRVLSRHRAQARAFGLVCIDLDGFKSINEQHGHAIGDALLKEIGSRLTRAVRTKGAISRRGGDEFLCLLLDVKSHQQVASIAWQLFDAVFAPCQLGPLSLCVRPSIGVALYPQDGSTIGALLESAGNAMFWAKEHRLGHAFSSQLAWR